MNNKGQVVNTASHILLWLVIIAIGVWLIWSATHTNTNKTVNLAGSAPQETTINKGFMSDLIEINLSCVPKGLVNKTYNNGVTK